MNARPIDHTAQMAQGMPPMPGWWMAPDGTWHPPTTGERSKRIQVVLVLAIVGGLLLLASGIFFTIVFNASVNNNCPSIYGCQVKPGVTAVLNLGMVTGLISAAGGAVGLFIARAQK